MPELRKRFVKQNAFCDSAREMSSDRSSGRKNVFLLPAYKQPLTGIIYETSPPHSRAKPQSFTIRPQWSPHRQRNA